MRPTQPNRLRVWVTRSEPGAAATAGRLACAGHEALIAPVLEVVRLQSCLPTGLAPAALAFTSANAVRAWIAAGGGHDAPAFVVGDATAEVAREAGFAAVRSADGDVAALAALLAADPPRGPLLHPCAAERAGDLAKALADAGVEVRILPLYRTHAIPMLPSTVDAALAGGAIDAVLLHSPKAARVLASLLAVRPAEELGRVWALGLSPACIAPLADLPFAARRAAKAPNEAALLERLG